MAARRRGDSQDESLAHPSDADGARFSDLVDGVRPLGDRDLRRPADAGREAPSAPRPEPVRFVTPDPGEPLLGYADGIDRSTFAKLRAGGIRPERRLDLHGLDRGAARRALHAELDAAWGAGERCLLVVHGRGRGSSEGPVLRGLLPGWLAEPPGGPRVLAFAPAAAADGGAGATYVLLRRRRGREAGPT